MGNFYDVSGCILGKLFQKQGTIKSLVMNEKNSDKKHLFAVLCETLKYRTIIDIIIEKSQVQKQCKKISKPVLTILIYDLLFGKGIRNAGNYKQLIMKHKARLNAELVKIKIKMGVKDNKDLIPDHIRNAIILPRYIRVNTLKTTMKQAISHFEKKGFTLSDKNHLTESLPMTMYRDVHLNELLILPANVDLHEDEFLLSGKIIIQDKASCFPAFILNPPKNVTVIDGCSAPGNKTSHLSMIMGNTGKIFAYDMDRRRLATLEFLTKRAGCTNIQPVCGSFLEIDPKKKEFIDVEYILLDPSCSGSGIVGRMDHLTQDIQEEEMKDVDAEDRVEQLANFQKQVLLHAFTFPKVKKVVYSTCSKHQEENELVVKYVLEQNKDFRLVTNVFPGWDRRGDDIVLGGNLLLTKLSI
jgi:putative methyltransferase